MCDLREPSGYNHGPSVFDMVNGGFLDKVIKERQDALLKGITLVTMVLSDGTVFNSSGEVHYIDIKPNIINDFIEGEVAEKFLEELNYHG